MPSDHMGLLGLLTGEAEARVVLLVLQAQNTTGHVLAGAMWAVGAPPTKKPELRGPTAFKVISKQECSLTRGRPNTPQRYLMHSCDITSLLRIPLSWTTLKSVLSERSRPRVQKSIAMQEAHGGLLPYTSFCYPVFLPFLTSNNISSKLHSNHILQKGKNSEPSIVPEEPYLKFVPFLFRDMVWFGLRNL